MPWPTTRLPVLASLLIITMASTSMAHLAQNPDRVGSPTSAGFGGPLLDPDPCRRMSQQADLPGPPVPLTDEGILPGFVSPVVDCNGPPAGNNGVSGTYGGSMVLAAVECLGGFPLIKGTHDPCTPGVMPVVSNQPADWASTGFILCGVEFIDGAGVLDEAFIDNGPAAGNTPDGTWDDGGIGGACHVSGYGPGHPPNANTNPDGGGANANNAPTECTGTAYAEDWVLGADVPLVVGCDSVNMTSPHEPLFRHLSRAANCALPPRMPECVIDPVVDCLFPWIGPPCYLPVDPAIDECVPDASSSAIDTANLGKGGGHFGEGVRVPGPVEPCTRGDIAIFVPWLISANPFGQVYKNEADGAHGSSVDEHFGWPFVDTDAEIVSDWNNDGVLDGSGDTIVYPATAGWVDHFYDPVPSEVGASMPEGCHGPPDDPENPHTSGGTGLNDGDGPTSENVIFPGHEGPGDCG